MSTSIWHRKRGELRDGALDVHVNPLTTPVPGWKRSGIRVGDASNPIALPADSCERVIVIASGQSVTVTYGSETVTLHGRADVFDGPADVLYLPINTAATVAGAARVIIGESLASVQKSPVVMRAKDVPVLIRGAGRETRQIHNFCMPETIDADRIICVEGIVPAGNWSGVPAHKHDTYIPGVESQLEEIYYFECAVARGVDAPTSAEPTGYFRGYASDDRPFDVDATLHDQDVVLVPHGYHGPVAATPGYDLYFFNVMAGSDPQREWNVTDDPCHGWIRETWQNQEPDPRLPYQKKSAQ